MSMIVRKQSSPSALVTAKKKKKKTINESGIRSFTQTALPFSSSCTYL